MTEIPKLDYLNAIQIKISRGKNEQFKKRFI